MTAERTGECPTRNSDFDPRSDVSLEATYADYARQRRECPVAYSDAFGGFWSLNRFEDVAMVLQNPGEFISSVQTVVPRLSTTGRKVPLSLDPPEHTPYRKAIDRALGLKRVASLATGIRGHAKALLAPIVARGEGDVVEEFGSPLPVRVFADWMGLAPKYVDVLWQVGKDYIRAWEQLDLEIVKSSLTEMEAIAAELIADRISNPRDPAIDPTSSLLSAQAAGEPLDPVLLAGSVRQILVVGIIAPPLVIGNIALHLARDPTLHLKLRENPPLIPEATEEFLRLYTPYRGFARTSRSGVTLRGRDIAPREPIALCYASANRDEAVFPDGDEFRFGRPNLSSHLAFGGGPHRCPGNALARLELRIALEELVLSCSRLELTGPVHLSSIPEIGPTSAPVRFVP